MMEGKKAKPRAILVFGAPCSGKTTFAKKFAEKYDLAYFNLEEVQSQYNFDHAEVLTVLELIAKTHHTLVIEGCIGTENERQDLKKLLVGAGYEVALVWVQTDVATIRSRMKIKYKSVTKAKSVYDASINELEAPTELEKPIILSGKHTFETQAKHVIAGLADADRR